MRDVGVALTATCICLGALASALLGAALLPWPWALLSSALALCSTLPMLLDAGVTMSCWLLEEA